MKNRFFVLHSFSISLLLVSIVSCSEQEKATFNYTLSIKDTLEIPIDSKTSATHSLVRYNYDSKKQEIYFIDRDIVKFYDIDTRKLINEIKLQTDGPNGTQGAEQALFINPDTIFIKGHNPLYIHQINWKGEKKQTFDLSKNGSNRVFYSNSNSTLEYFNNHLYFYLNAAVSGDKILLDAPAFFSISIQDSKVEALPFKFPVDFKDDSKQWVFIHYNPGMTLANGQIVASFPLLDKIYVYDIEHGILKDSKSVKSYFQKIPNEVATRKSGMDIEKAFYGQYQTTTAYNYIASDPYRKVYYRFVLHSKEYEAKSGLIALESILNQKPISIQIISEDLKLLGEIQLPPQKYSIDDYFVGKDGLYISNNNLDNTNTDENKLSYTRFVVDRLP